MSLEFPDQNPLQKPCCVRFNQLDCCGLGHRLLINRFILSSLLDFINKIPPVLVEGDGHAEALGLESFSVVQKKKSYTPSPPRYRSRRNQSPTPRGRYGGRIRDLPTSLLMRNLRLDCRPEDLHLSFGEFGPLKDVYLPRDYYTGESRGFGFVHYLDPDDAAEAKYQMDGQILFGRELTVVFAEENRKKPSDMRARERSRGRSYDRRGSSTRYSLSPPCGRLYHRSPRYHSPPRRDRYLSRSISPQDQRHREKNPFYSRPPPYGSMSRSPVGY